MARCSSDHVRRTTRARRLFFCTLVFSASASAQDPARPPEWVPTSGLLDALVPQVLRDAIRRANPELGARRAAVEAVRARARATGFAAPSTLTAELEEIPSIANVPHAGSIKVNLERELFSGVRRDAARAVAAADVSTATVALTVTERRLDATAALALATATGNAAVSSRLAAEDSLLMSAEASVQTRFSVGEAKYVDVLRLRTERLRVQSERLTTLTQARLGRQTLIALVTPGGAAAAPVIGDTTTRGPTLARDAVRFVDSLLAARIPLVNRVVLPPTPDTDSLLATTGRLAAANAAFVRAQSIRALVIADLRPRISAILGAQRFVGDNGGFTVGPTIGATVTLPFTARTATSTARVAAERDLVSAAADRDAVIASARADLLAAAERYDAARSRVNAYDTALLRGAREEREAALASYRTSGITLLELLDFERALARAEIDRIRGVIDAAAALADLLAGGSVNPAAQSSGSVGMSSGSTGPSQ